MRALRCHETAFEIETGAAAIIDFMPPTNGTDLVRSVTDESGRVTFQTEFVARFDTLPFTIRDQRPYCSSLTFSIQSTGLPFSAS
jgi:hypothetical protein